MEKNHKPDAMATLKDAGLRPTRQRIALAKLMFGKGRRHITAEQIHSEALNEQVRLSLATVYNALNQFTAAGLLRQVIVDPGRTFYCTATHEHHHFFYEKSGRLEDIPEDSIAVARLPEPPAGTSIARVDVVVRVNG